MNIIDIISQSNLGLIFIAVQNPASKAVANQVARKNCLLYYPPNNNFGRNVTFVNFVGPCKPSNSRKFLIKLPIARTNKITCIGEYDAIMSVMDIYIVSY